MKRGKFFRKDIVDFLKHSIIEGRRILIVGGNIAKDAAAFKPSYSVELFSPNLGMAGLPVSGDLNIVFKQGNIADFKSSEPFDYIIFYTDLSYEGDLYQIFASLKSLMHKGSKVFIMEINPFILFALKFLGFFGVPIPKLERNILYLGDLKNLINIFGFDILDSGYRFACPFKMFGLGGAVNAVVPRLLIFRHLCFGQYLVFRKHPGESEKKQLSCSVVIPCYNEEGNIKECVQRVPDFGSWREIIVVDDGSKDRTREIVTELMQGRADIRLVTYGSNRGKGYAINKGWSESKGDVFMMLDCDCTTPPEELVLFHDAMEHGAEFINGTRVIYPREKNSLPLLNRLGVSFFAKLISWITQRRITDTFCGTKVFLGKDWECFKIKEFLWGDWDLFFTAARLRMKMLEMPVHYKARKFGEAKMRPLKHGSILFLKSLQGLKAIK